MFACSNTVLSPEGVCVGNGSTTLETVSGFGPKTSTATSAGLLSNNFSAAIGLLIASSAILKPFGAFVCSAIFPTVTGPEAPATILPDKSALRPIALPALNSPPRTGIVSITPKKLSTQRSTSE